MSETTAESHTKPVRIKKLCQAWNAFARLLDLKPDKAFECPLCSLELHTVICDGTMIGFRKDFLPQFKQLTAQSQPIITGSKHSERILVSSAKARSLLLAYSGVTKDRKRSVNPKQLSATEFREFRRLTREDFPSLTAFLQSLQKETGSTIAPPQYHQFFSELARCSPACGIYQVREKQSVFDVLQRVLSGDEDIFDSTNHADLSTLQAHVPILVQFLEAATRGGQDKLSDVVCALISQILDVCRAPFSKPPPPSSCYLPPTADELSFFPNLPLQSGHGNNAADKSLKTCDSNSCRKASYGHPSLSPGIFTVFCPHAWHMLWV